MECFVCRVLAGLSLKHSNMAQAGRVRAERAEAMRNDQVVQRSGVRTGIWTWKGALQQVVGAALPVLWWWVMSIYISQVYCRIELL